MNTLQQYLQYLKNNPKHYWFRRKLYGWGWFPATWQGVVVTLLYIAVVLLVAFTYDPESPRIEVFATFVLPLVLCTAAFLRVVYKKGEKPHWSWGFPSVSKDTPPAPRL